MRTSPVVELHKRVVRLKAVAHEERSKWEQRLGDRTGCWCSR